MRLFGLPSSRLLCFRVVTADAADVCYFYPFQKGALMFTSDLLKNKRFLVTGGGTGIGRALAERFLQLGATGYICGRRAEVVAQTANELAASTGGAIEAFACDVRDHDDVEKAIEQLWAKGPLDILVNNAAGNFLAKTETLSSHAFDAVIGIVLKAPST